MALAVRCSSAAPTFFPSVTITEDDIGVEKGSMHVDGGVVSNNPCFDTALYAKSKGISTDCLHVVSLGTGEFPQSDEVGDSALYWAVNGLAKVAIVDHDK